MTGWLARSAQIVLREKFPIGKPDREDAQDGPAPAAGLSSLKQKTRIWPHAGNGGEATARLATDG